MKKNSIVIFYIFIFTFYCYSQKNQNINQVEVLKKNNEITINVNFNISVEIKIVWEFLIDPLRLMEIYDEYENISTVTLNDKKMRTTYIVKIPIFKNEEYTLLREINETNKTINWSLISSKRIEKIKGKYVLTKTENGTNLNYSSMIKLKSNFLNFFKNITIKKKTIKSVEKLIEFLEE